MVLFSLFWIDSIALSWITSILFFFPPSLFRLLMPFLCREMVELLDKSDSVVNHTSLSNYAFLYGVFPAAPGVAIFAAQFNMEVGIVCSLFLPKLVIQAYFCWWNTYNKQASWNYFSVDSPDLEFELYCKFNALFPGVSSFLMAQSLKFVLILFLFMKIVGRTRITSKIQVLYIYFVLFFKYLIFVLLFS